MKRLLVIAATTALASGSGLAATALAAPSPTGVTHRNVHVCATPSTAGIASCHAIRHDTLRDGKPVSPNATSPTGYGPSDLRSAYNLTTTGSSSTTIAIVDAYDLPTAESDLATYRSTFGLPACTSTTGCFRQVGQTGGARPAADASWGQEIALDIDMASAICPNCKILLVEATSASLADLATAVNWAATQGVAVISNSYGGTESSPNGAYNHSGIAITVSTGDSGYGVQSPASYPWVTAVGGTSLTRATNTRGWTETAWSGAGSGCSRYSAKPSFQANVATSCSNRAVADVSAIADPNTGVAVYDSTAYQGASGWLKFGGTSVAAPVIAGVYALAGTGLSNATPYGNTAALYDVTSGKNGRCNRTPVLCTAGAGWDGPTGLGTPNGTAAF